MSDHVVARLERMAREIADEWGFVLGPRIRAGRYSYVAPAGQGAILKIIPVEDDDADRIADALALWDGNGAVRLLRHDPARRALLLERVVPGTEASASGPSGASARSRTRVWTAIASVSGRSFAGSSMGFQRIQASRSRIDSASRASCSKRSAKPGRRFPAVG